MCQSALAARPPAAVTYIRRWGCAQIATDPAAAEDVTTRLANAAFVRGGAPTWRSNAPRGHIAAGHRWMVDLDLAKVFDTVNHDVLMHRVALRVRDNRVRVTSPVVSLRSGPGMA